MDKAVLIVYLGNDERELMCNNETFGCQNYPLTVSDLNHVIESLKDKYKLKNVIIINVIPLTNK